MAVSAAASAPLPPLVGELPRRASTMTGMPREEMKQAMREDLAAEQERLRADNSNGREKSTGGEAGQGNGGAPGGRATGDHQAGQQPATDTPWFKEALANGGVGKFIDIIPPKMRWTFKDSLLSRTAGILAGPGAAGKSTFSLLMLMAAATGEPILPGILEPVRAGKVIGVFCEDDESVLHHRVHALANNIFCGNESAKQKLRENMRIVCATGKDVRMVSTLEALAATSFFNEVFAAIKDEKDLDLIILDPLARLHGEDENNNAIGTFLVTLVERLAQQTGAAVLSLHHVSKRAGLDGGSFSLDAAMHQDVSRGATALTNGVRWQANLFALPETYVKSSLKIKDAKPGQYLAFKVSKKNYGPPEEIHYLERGFDGVLMPARLPGKDKLEPDLSALIQDLILEAVKQDGSAKLSKRMLLDANQTRWKEVDNRITRRAIDLAMAELLAEERLFEKASVNAMGRSIVTLSLVPDKPAEAEPTGADNTDFPDHKAEENTGKTPEDITPEHRKTPENSFLPGCNTQESQEETIPDKKLRTKERFQCLSA
jgi:regulatory protein RepA